MNGTRPTKKQRELLSFITGFIAGHGYGPSYREIMRALNYKSVSTVAIHIDNLIAKGYLRKRDNSARSLEVCHVTEPQFVEQKPITHAQEKWLVELIGARFKEIEQKPALAQDIDQLYVLVGALHILGFTDAARAYKGRLATLAAKPE
jgi:SOS-response transcriptional repressor LexA